MAAQDQRPTFYEGQYLAAADVTAVVEYAHVQSARHELGAHTWGTLCGLGLVERPTAGAPSQRLVYLTPGVAEDGFGRKLVALSVARLPESLFGNIAYDASVDDPALNGGIPLGRFVRVWLTYDEAAGQAAGPGFAACDAGNTSARVQETYRFVVGDVPKLSDRRSTVSVGGRGIDAQVALSSFDPSAPSVYDASIPQQLFPETTQGVRWLVPIGWVRWVVFVSGGGYFVDRDIVASDKGTERIRRSMRAYGGAIAEGIYAPDGAIVLRNRGEDPTQPGRFTERLASSDPLVSLLGDLVWVEGTLRVLKDVRIAGGALRFADPLGHDVGTPLSIERVGDSNPNPGQRALDALIGPDTQLDNRFAVAVVKGDPDPTKRTLVEKLTVLSNGNVGLGNPAPGYRLHAKGDRIRLETADSSEIVDLRVDAPDVTLETSTSNLVVRATGGVPVHNLLLNPDPANGKVGIGTHAPAGQLHVVGDQILLEDAGATKRIKLFNTGSDVDLFTDTHRLSLRSSNNNACVINWIAGDGNVGIGTGSPTQKLHVGGEFALVDGLGGEQAYLGGDGVGGDVQIGSLNSAVSRITCWNAANNTPMALYAGSYFLWSDGALKTNVRTVKNALELVQQLRGVRFQWKSSPAPQGDVLGVIAQEVAAVLPEAVTSVRGRAALAQGSLEPVLIEAVKELTERVRALEAEFAPLRDKLAVLTGSTAASSGHDRRGMTAATSHAGAPAARKRRPRKGRSRVPT